MRAYKYFGNAVVEADDVVLKKFGQEYRMADAVALELARHGSGILLSADFDTVGFSPSCLKDRRERHPNNAAYMAAHQRAMAAQKELAKFLAKELEAAAS